MLHRYLMKDIQQDLAGKMVFLSGPRQVGKTTLARQIGEEHYRGKFEYLNWDNGHDRKQILAHQWQAEKRLFILDEIHKYKLWKNLLKGQYDKYKDQFSILVTGSGRLDVYRKGGDSLLGRYHHYRLHPLSVSEASGKPAANLVPLKILEFSEPSPAGLFKRLLKFGGFPEVFLKQDERELRRWHQERTDRLIKEDIRDVELVRDISALQVLVSLLPERVGSLFSLNALREDLQVTHKTLSLWVEILERFYYHFRIYPFSSRRINALRKEPKLYLWDWSEVPDEAARLENAVASHLLKFCHFLTDVHGYKAALHYLRDKEQREVDFLLCVDQKPWFCVEVKNNFKEIPSPLRYFSARLNIPYSFLVTLEPGVDLIKDHFRVISVDKFLTGLV